jgi:hypothetical protein
MLGQRAPISLRRALVFLALGLLTGVQIALYLFDRYDDGVADIRSALIGAALFILSVGFVIWSYRRIVPVAVLFAVNAQSAAAQSARVELDHVFIVVTPGAASEIAALRAAGLNIPSEKPRKHEGQGTASIAAYFENAYLELIWVDSTVSVNPELARTAQWFRDASAWRTNRHSPFGLGLRRLPGDTAALPVPVEREAASWLRPGEAYELLRQAADTMAADLFVVPASTAVPSWIARAREREPALWQHPRGGREITHLRFHGLAQQQPAALRVVRPLRVEVAEAPAALLELEIDKAARGERVDLRPTLPLVILR